MELSTEFLIIFGFVLFFSALVQGSIGFGFPLISTPLLAMATDMKTAVLYVLIPTLLINIISIFSEGNFFTGTKTILSIGNNGYDWKCHWYTNTYS